MTSSNLKTKVLGAFFGALWRTVLTIPVQLAGFVMVAAAIPYRKTPLADLPRWLIPWANPEDWTGGWLGHTPKDNCVPLNLRADYSGIVGFYRYHAFRNRAHGLRNYEWYLLKIRPAAVAYYATDDIPWFQDWWLWKAGFAVAGKSYWYVAWQGKYVGVKWIRYFKAFGALRYVEMKFGWRITPADTNFLPSSMRHLHGTNTTLQVLPKFGRAGSDYQ